jgi:hypothetical protein
MKIFAQALCEHFGCAPDDYLRVALKHCLYPQARVFFQLPPFHVRGADARLLEAARTVTREEALEELLREYRKDLHHHGGWLAKRCRLRVSGRRLLALLREVMPPA